MASKRERVIDAVVEMVKGAFPGVAVLRNSSKPEEIGADGFVSVFDGDPGDPDVTLSPVTYIYDHRIPIQVASQSGSIEDAESALDDMLVQLGQAVDADRTLGGLCDYIQFEAPATNPVEATGAETERSAETAIIATYGTRNPLT